MGEVRFMISEAAKKVKVESHVLRYWEEELDLEIGRTEMGHRYYTKDDIQLFRCIKKLKDEGMLLKDLKPLVRDLKETRLRLKQPATKESQQSGTSDNSLHTERSTGTSSTAKKAAHWGMAQAVKRQAVFRTCQAQTSRGQKPFQPSVSQTVTGERPTQPAPVQTATPHKATITAHDNQQTNTSTSAAQTCVKTNPDKLTGQKDTVSLSVTQSADVIPPTQLEQVRTLIGDVLTDVVTANNEILKKDISKTVTRDVMKEMDFLFQARERQEEEHFRKLDCLIRQQQANRREASRETPMGKFKKLLT